MNPLRHRHPCRASELQPGDVIRTAENTAFTIETSRPDPNEAGGWLLESVAGVIACSHDTPIYRWVVAEGPDAHYPVCSICGEVWPCIHVQALTATDRAIWEERYACHRCAQSTFGCKTVRVMTVTDRGPKELLFHGRKGPCLTAARKLDPEARTNW
jgi:hypothetical protein